MLAKNDFVAIVDVIKRIRDDWIRSVDKSIKGRLKHADQVYNFVLSLSKCSITIGDEKEKKKEKEKDMEQLEKLYLYSLS